jgi:hypothetical protein
VDSRLTNESEKTLCQSQQAGRAQFACGRCFKAALQDEGVATYSANVTMEKLNDEELKEREAALVEQYGGILPYYEAFYIESISYAADRCEDAFRRFDAAVTGTGAEAVILATIQEALTHAAALSRFFWPTKGRLFEARGERLREAFDLSDASPLKPRDLRNAFEHFDERLDRFLLLAPVGYFFPSPIVGSHQLADEDLANIFKLVDPEKGICVVLGKKFEFQTIRTEVQKILARALEMHAQGSRLG